ncbi:MAG: glycosyltransferase family 4 protein [Alphaproteobacteria bacterium]|nr:glycosyltransferase family 4 protein [Alphaproteobacteria bacterium]
MTEDWYFCSHRLAVARAARAAGMEVFVATHVTTHGEQILSEGFHLLPLHLRRRSLNPFTEIRLLIELFRIYRSVRPDLAHHVAMKPVIYGSLVAWLQNVPAVVNALTGLGFVFASTTRKASLLRFFVRRTLRFLLNRVNGKALLQNRDDFQALKEVTGLTESRMALIPGSGVDTDHFRPLAEPDERPITVAIICRMLRDKGVRELIEAARLLHQRNIPIHVLLAGTPDPENPTSLSAEELEAWDREAAIDWLGFCDDVREVWKRTHIATLPSYYGEGIPKSLLEAAACARPIVTTDAPGCREVVQAEVTGLLVPPRDPEALADALARLAQETDLRISMGQRGRDFVEEAFSERLVSERTMALYRALTGLAS